MKVRIQWFLQEIFCRFGSHAWGPVVSVPFFQEELDVRFCRHCKAQEPFLVPTRLSLGGHR